jgi:hypothetical protein
MSALDSLRLNELVPGVLGGLVTGLYHFSAIVVAGGSPTRADYLRLLLNMGAAMVVGALFAFFLTPVALAGVPWAPLKDASAISFAIGLLSWELLPLFYLVAKNRAKKEADKLGGE